MSDTARTEAQNIEVMRRGYEAFAKGDIEALKTLFSANANWNQTETGVLPGNYRGAQAILEYFGQLAHESQGSLRVEPQTMAASGDHVFVLERVTGTRKGKTLDTTDVLVFKLNDGIVTEVTNFPSNHPADIQFWS
jgi:ketosteroid isomerase-like protein